MTTTQPALYALLEALAEAGFDEECLEVHEDESVETDWVPATEDPADTSRDLASWIASTPAASRGQVVVQEGPGGWSIVRIWPVDRMV